MTPAVVFDLGKVLVDFDYRIAIDRIAARGRVTAAEIAAHVNASPLLMRYEAGLLTSDQFYSEVCSVTGYSGSMTEFATCFGDIFTPINPMIELHRELKRRGLPTFIFSNTNDLAIRHIRAAFPFFAEFSGYILSYEHGFMKPDPKLYEIVEREGGKRGSEIVYFDDRPENIETAAARGWTAILQENPENTWEAVRKLGLLPSGCQTAPP